ncbi:MAG: hypothetical protein KY437_03550 [Actinobacteria bacterium]|nr:hypothetical protein [Actinomycetota bacterium]
MNAHTPLGGRREPWRRGEDRQEIPGAQRRSWAQIGMVTLAYAAVFAVVAWPLFSRITTHVPIGGDAGTFIWGFWWVRDSIEHLRYPLSTTHMFHPVGTPLVFHTLMPLLAVVSIPLQWLLGVGLAYNLIAGSALVLAAVGAFVLARDVGLDGSSSFVTGLAYGFAPTLVDRLAIEHLNLAFTVWVPLSLLALRATLRSGRRRPSLVLGVLVAFAVYTDLTIAVFTGLALTAYLAGWLWQRRHAAVESLRTVTRRLWPGAALATLVVAPLVAVMVRTTLAGEHPGVDGLGGARLYSADLVSFLVPSPRHAGVGWRTAEVYERLDGLPNDGTAYLGGAIVVLAAAGLVRWRRRPLVRWSALLAAVGMVLALGPVLHVNGRELVPLAVPAPDGDGTMSSLLPFSWLTYVPSLTGLRSPVRFLTLTALGIALLAGFGLRSLFEGIGRTGRVLALVLVTGLVAVESLSSFVSLRSSAVPGVYAAIANGGRGAVVNVPLGFRSGLGQGYGEQQGAPMIWATYHEHPVAAGFGSRTAPWRLNTLASMPLYRDILALQEDPAARAAPTEGRASALELGARWVVVDGDHPAVVRYVTEVGYQEVARDGAVVLYELPELSPAELRG